ncbi:hypothetical protein RKD24_005337 [Streptomyces calvus]
MVAPPARASSRWARSRVPGSRRTGYMVVNQPTVRARSAPGSSCSSRPCPSTSTSTDVSVVPRQDPTATAKAASSTSDTPVPNAVPTVVSTVSVTSAGSLTEKEPADVRVSSAGSRRPLPSVGPASRSVSAQWPSSPVRDGSSAAVCRASAQRRKEVPTGLSPGPVPAAAACAASARSGTITRQETPSTTRWSASSRSRPGAVGPRSSQTAWSMTPSAGASRCRADRAWSPSAARRVSSSVPLASTRVRHCPAVTAPGSRIRVVQAPGPSGTHCMRRASCRSSTACTAPSRWACSMPAGTCSRTDWLNRSTAPPRSASQCMIGVSGTGPQPGSSAPCASSSGRPGVASQIAAASSSTVRWSKTSRGLRTRPALRARLTSWMDMMLSPPRSKKLSCTPTESRPSTSAKRAHSVSSTRPAGALPGVAARYSGAGRALRSSFPLVVSGSSGSGTSAVGTM